MSLSLSKLTGLLQDKGFIANKFYTIDGYCFYIELFAINTADIFFLYIPSKYNFPLEESKNTYKMKYININPEKITEQYGKIDLEELYENERIQLSPSRENLEDHLENNYKNTIKIDDVSEKDITIIAGIIRQLKRLRFCVQTVKYKIAIVYKNYICAIRRDDSIDVLLIKHYPRIDSKKLFIVVDLETFYEKSEEITDNISSVRNGIYKVLEKNLGTHTTILKKMSENKKNIVSIPQKAQEKKQKYEQMLNKLQKSLNIIQKSLSDLKEQYRNTDRMWDGSVTNDVQKSYRKNQLQLEIEKLSRLQTEVSKNMLYLRDKRENAILEIDKIAFDNTVMFNHILKNFAELEKIS